MVGSTDMGNVTFAVPAIHPMYKIGDGQAVNHTRPFTAVAGGYIFSSKVFKVAVHTCDVL